MARAYLWKHRPKDDEAMRRKIARALGADVDGFKDVLGPDSVTVRVAVSRVYRHFWKDHPDRWSMVPLIPTILEKAHRVAPTPKKGVHLYSTELSIGQRGGAFQKVYFASYCRERGAGRSWRSTFDQSQKKLAAREAMAGVPSFRRNPRHSTETRNPTPAPPHPGASRSGRPPEAYQNHTMRGVHLSSGQVALIFIGLLGVAYAGRTPGK